MGLENWRGRPLTERMPPLTPVLEKLSPLGFFVRLGAFGWPLGVGRVLAARLLTARRRSSAGLGFLGTRYPITFLAIFFPDLTISFPDLAISSLLFLVVAMITPPLLSVF